MIQRVIAQKKTIGKNSILKTKAVSALKAAFLTACCSFLLAPAMTVCASDSFSETVTAGPEIVENETLPAGSETIWNCVYFGSYPAAEICAEEDTESPAVSEIAVKEGDLIIDGKLYAKLEEAEWTDDETVVDGVRYRRLKPDSSEPLSRPQHFAWESPDEYRYFRYEPVRWRIIEQDGQTATLMADRLLECAAFNEQAEDVSWESCTLRSFLNGYDETANAGGISYAQKPQDSFLGSAFSDEERAAVLKGTVRNPDNYYFGTDCGSDTEDCVYIPDEEEVFSSPAAAKHGFAESDGVGDTARRFQPTRYAMARGAWFSETEGNEGNGFWFLRTSGYTPSNANYVCDFGYIYNRGIYVTTGDCGILPVIRVDLQKAKPAGLAGAGTVSSADIFRTKDEEDAKSSPETADYIAEPVVEKDDDLPTGQKTTWNCVYFGSYPTCEIVGEDFRAVAPYAAADTDAEVDSALFKRLEEAEWDGNETVLDDIRYRRIRGGDTENKAVPSPQHYVWDDPEAYHYFRYDPIKWRIIEVNDKAVTLLSDREMDCAPYNTVDTEVNWESCTLRSFLNGYDASCNSAGIDYSNSPSDSFFGTAFLPEEQQGIIPDAVENPKNSYYGTDCGNTTLDRVFILSSADVFSSEAAGRHGFYMGNGVDDPARRFRPTMYAMARGTWYSPVEAYRGNGFWFMRTNGYTGATATYICDFGYIYNRGTGVICNDSGILPAIRVDLAKVQLKEAGTVSSDEIMR